MTTPSAAEIARRAAKKVYTWLAGNEPVESEIAAIIYNEIAAKVAIGEGELPPLSWDEIDQFDHMADSWKDMPQWARELFRRAAVQLRTRTVSPTAEEGGQRLT